MFIQNKHFELYSRKILRLFINNKKKLHFKAFNENDISKKGWRAVWFTIRNCEPGSQFCEPGSQFDVFFEPVTSGDSFKSLRGAHATS
jgi:hypothetical protein